MIDNYSFGQIQIDGKKYTSDVIIYRDHVDSRWWRKEGHNLLPGDITEIIAQKPNILVMGTGTSGCMNISSEVKELLSQEGIKLIAKDTEQACQEYNRLAKSGDVVGAFHLTC